MRRASVAANALSGAFKINGLRDRPQAWGARGRVFESLRPDQKTPKNPSTYGCLDFFMPVFFLSWADFRYFGHRWVTVSGSLHGS